MSQFLSLAASLLLLLAPTWAGIIAQPAISYLGTGDEHAVAHTQHNVVRSFDGTVSHYAKSVATPFSQVHKQDTRISNNVYQPTVAKAFSYAPASTPVAIHAEPSNLFTQATPVAPVYHQPAYVQAPAVYHQPTHVEAPAVYHQPAHVQAPAVYHQPAHIPSTVVGHQPAVIHYSPAETVSHMSFDGFGTHYGF
ncbi:uncharacterized protein Dana_GF23782 [Drosophila ananassae]|uniref:Uncharacterized protein n=1 Tax=Drosophila ananassae TaxID=7217 RepID=B3M600_DROAN|nr:pupal cuticle protein C1B [Drosophila ananassae]EDV40716.1 uncharacterized protein Dana_GF23782 [Drosophila ananassae]